MRTAWEQMSDQQQETTYLRTEFGGRWNADLNAYEDIQAVSFDTQADLDRAIISFWEVPELKNAPREHVGELTMLVPAEAARLLRHNGFSFIQARVAKDGSQERSLVKGTHTLTF